MPDFASLRFLAPGGGLTALAIGLPILLLLYFLKLRRRPVRVSSAMLWRDAARDLQVNVPWRFIRPSWLLLLQILILCLLAGALARPVLDLAAAPPAHTVIVIDHSASMAAREDSGSRSRLDVAKRRAASLIGRLSESAGPVRFTVISFASRPVVRYGEGADAGAARAAIEAIEQTDEPGDLGAALQLLKAVTASGSGDRLSGDEPETPGRAVRVVFISDGGDAARLASSTDLSGLGDVDFEFVRVGGGSAEAPPENLGITALAARTDYDDPTLVRVFAAVESNAERARTTSISATLTPFGSGDAIEIGAWAIQVPRATADGPGRATRSFDLIAPAGGVLRVRLGLDDALESDDSAWITLSAPTPPEVWLVRGDDADETAASASLRDAIEAVIGASPRVMTRAEYAGLVVGEAPDVVVFDGVTPSATPLAPSLSFGGGLPIPGLILERPEDPRPTQVAFWTRSDPLMRGVTFPGTTVYAPGVLTLPDPEARASMVREARAVARGSDGPLIAYLRDVSPRVVVAFAPGDTNWWRDPSFPVFVANAIETLAQSGATAGETGRVVRTGESVTLADAPPGESAVLTGPSGFTRALVAGSDPGIGLGVLPYAGVYRVDDEAVVAASVLDPIETSLVAGDELTIGGRSVAGAGVEEVAPREIWHWFAICAVVLLAVEWFAYALRMRT